MADFEKGITAKVKDEFNMLNNINTLALAKIIEVDNENLEAIVQKIAMTEFDGEYTEEAEIVAVPIMPIFNSSSFFINAPYNTGDLVVVGFCQHSLEGTLDETVISEPGSCDRYSDDDAFIIGNITAQYNDMHSQDLSMVHKETGNFIKLTNSGGIEIQGNVNISGDLTISGTSTAADHVSDGISGRSHKHGKVQTGGGETDVPK